MCPNNCLKASVLWFTRFLRYLNNSSAFMYFVKCYSSCVYPRLFIPWIKVISFCKYSQKISNARRTFYRPFNDLGNLSPLRWILCFRIWVPEYHVGRSCLCIGSRSRYCIKFLADFWNKMPFPGMFIDEVKIEVPP